MKNGLNQLLLYLIFLRPTPAPPSPRGATPPHTLPLSSSGVTSGSSVGRWGADSNLIRGFDPNSFFLLYRTYKPHPPLFARRPSPVLVLCWRGGADGSL